MFITLPGPVHRYKEKATTLGLTTQFIIHLMRINRIMLAFHSKNLLRISDDLSDLDEMAAIFKAWN